MWLNVGGRDALASYGDAGIPDIHWRFLDKRCVDQFETDSHIFVHGGLDPDVPLAEQKIHILRWKTFRDPKPHCSGKTMICGHSTQKSGWPCDLGSAVCIDTGVSRGGWLTCLDAESGNFWQADQRGRGRRGHLKDIPKLR
jgi:serine/threonine protein phosphatase 1